MALAAVMLCAASTYGQDTQRQYLSGHGKDDPVQWEFLCTAGARSGSWTTIPVPSNWDVVGFGTLNYGRDNTKEPVEQGRYRHTFKVPADWAGQRVFLVFEGVMTDTQVTLNGRFAGPMHQGGFYRFRYEVGRLIKFGQENLLEVTVDKLSANPSVNRAERQADYWVFGGIYRPVYLEAVPQQFLDRVAIDARANGTFVMDVFVNGDAKAGVVEAQIQGLDGKAVGEVFSQPVSAGKAALKTAVSSPRQWTAETPSLYGVEVRLKQGQTILHRIQQRFGFRTFEVREGDGLYLNGRHILLKGANRHSFWPDSGRCLSEAVHRMDIGLMKDMNMNAVRMSHYPPDSQFLDLCDEMGLYVLDELGGWQKSYDTEVGRKLVEEMVTRDLNHPAILFWDNGNEGGWNTELDVDFGRWDPQQRHVLHPWQNFGGVNTDHYETYESTQKLYSGNTIFMSTESLHGLYDGGAGAGLEDYWNLALASKVAGGQLIWALVDEGLKRPIAAERGFEIDSKIDVVGNAAPDGIVGPYREKEGSFYAIKQLWSPVTVEERTLPGDFSGVLTIQNRYSFTDVNQCRFTWQLRKFRRPGDGSDPHKVLAEATVQGPSIPPGGTRPFRLGLPVDWSQAEALALRIDDPAGHELWTWVWPLPAAAGMLGTVYGSGDQAVAAEKTDDTIVVKTADLTVQIDSLTGMLKAAQRGTQSFSLTNGPRPASGTAALAGLEQKQDGRDQVVTATFTGDLKSVTWRVQANGWVRCDYTYAAEGPADVLGVAFDYPEGQVKAKTWLGEGPYRVWKNRLAGATFGVWHNEYNDTITGWSGWTVPEFKGCFANVRWIQLETTEGPITVVLGADDLFVQVLTPSLPPKGLQAKTAVSLPQAGLAFLHAIPAMGNKFHTAAQAGPQGQPTVAHGEYAGSVSFCFGPLPKE
jgi:hypothetical protein